MRYIIGTDIGTTAAKTVLFDTFGRVIATHSAAYPLFQSKSGYAEQNPEDWYSACAEGLSAVTCGIDKKLIAGIGLSGQMHGLVMLDESGNLLRDAIIWCDRRAAREAAEIESIIGKNRLIALTCNPSVTGFTAAKLLWVRKHQADVYRKCAHILLPKDYVRFRLTGKYGTDVSDAGGTGLFDVANRDWAKEVCDALDIDMRLLPKAYESEDMCAVLGECASRDTGIPKGIPVAAGAGDQAAAALGCGIVEEGAVSDTLGTSGVVFCAADKPAFDSEGKLHTLCHSVRGKWHLMGVTQGFGLSIEWARNVLAPDLTFSEIDALAKSIPAGSDGLIFLPYLIGERCPHFDGDARGMFFGLNGLHTRAHMLRAVLEGVCFSQLDCLNLMRAQTINASEVRVGGGAAKSPLVCQMLADMFQADIAVCSGNENGALGAAILAGVAGGVFKDAAITAKTIVQTTKICNKGDFKQYEHNYEIYRALYAANKKLFKKLSLSEK